MPDACCCFCSTSTIADANAVDASGWTPLHCCLMHGHVAAAAALVKKHQADYTMEVACI